MSSRFMYGPGCTRLKPAPEGQIPVELHVYPCKAFVSVDGNSMGEARHYNDSFHPVWLKPGQHTLELQHAGFKTLRVRLDVQKGTPDNLHFMMNEGEGLDPRSIGIEATPEAQGGPGTGR